MYTMKTEIVAATRLSIEYYLNTKHAVWLCLSQFLTIPQNVSTNIMSEIQTLCLPGYY